MEYDSQKSLDNINYKDKLFKAKRNSEQANNNKNLKVYRENYNKRVKKLPAFWNYFWLLAKILIF
jgi:hypothetical protein